MRAPYRDDDDALEARLRSLTDQLEVGQARSRELRDLEEKGGKLEREIAGLRRELARRQAKRQGAAERPAPLRRFGRRDALAVAGCGLVTAWGALTLVHPSHAPPPGPGPTPGPAPWVDPQLVEALAAGAVYHDHFVRRVLYTWTTSEQVAELARTRQLLTKTRSPTKGLSFFDQRRERTSTGEGLMFSEPALARRRFAWSSPWPTLRGIGAAETYGDRLVRVTLKPDALVAYYGGNDGAWWQFYDLDGKPEPFDRVARDPERIAGVFHVFPGEGDHLPYRELVLCNESAIEEWSVDTPEIQAEVAASVDVLRRLREAIRRDPPDLAAMAAGASSVPREVWERRAGAPSLAALYEANLAFPGPRYRLDLETIDAMIEALLALPSGPALRHRPDVRFPGFRDGAIARSPNAVYGAHNRLPSSLPPGWNHAVKCVPKGTYSDCTPLGRP